MSKNLGVDRGMALIQDKAQSNILDYQFVMDCLKTYGSPRAKLTTLLKSGSLIHIRKGLYLLGERFKKSPYCLELLSNLIYGPSYVSLEKALQIYGLIPEHVEAVTSVTFKSSRELRTPIGDFLYFHCHPKSYSVGVTLKTLMKGENALIATPEKALADLLMIRRGKLTSLRQVKEIVLEDFRIEEEDLLKLDLQMIRSIRQAYQHSALIYLERWLTLIQENM